MSNYLGVLDTVPHDFFPMFINNLEKAALLWNLLHDVLRREDWLQVEPLGLQLQPLVYCFLDTDQLLLPKLKYPENGNQNKGLKPLGLNVSWTSPPHTPQPGKTLNPQFMDLHINAQFGNKKMSET